MDRSLQTWPILSLSWGRMPRRRDGPWTSKLVRKYIQVFTTSVHVVCHNSLIRYAQKSYINTQYIMLVSKHMYVLFGLLGINR